MPDQLVNLRDPDTGEIGSLPAAQVPQALQQGFAQVSPEELDQHFKEQKYGTGLQQLATGAESAASALTFGISTGAERALGVPAEDIRARREINPGVHAIGEMGGLGLGMLTGTGEAALMEKVGAKVAARIAGETALSKIGSTAARLATENAMFQAGDEVSKMFTSDPSQTIGTAMADIGLATLIGAGTGVAFGSVSPLWRATVGDKVDSFLNAVKTKAGGIDGMLSAPVADALEKSGLEFPPQLKAALSDNPQLQVTSKALEHSNTGYGIEHKQIVDGAKKELSGFAAGALGADAEKIAAASEVSQAEAGKGVGNLIADDLESRFSPIIKEMEELKGKAGNVEIPKASETEVTKMVTDPQDLTGVPKAVSEKIRTPGFSDEIGEKVSKIASENKWVIGDKTSGAKLYEFVMDKLPKLRDTEGLDSLVKRLRATAQDMVVLDRTPLHQAGQIAKVLREAEADLIEAKLGEKGAEYVQRFRAVRQQFSEAARVVDDLTGHIKLKNSPSSYSKALRAFSSEEGEKLLRSIAGDKNAAGLRFIQEQFPAAFEKFKEFHVDRILKESSKGMPAGEISLQKLVTKIGDMSPEMRAAIIPEEALQKIKAADILKKQLEKVPGNFSNTARFLDKLTEYIPGGAVAMAALLTGHNPLVATALGGVMKYGTREVPDAIRLAMLKFVGSSNGVEGGAFKAMVDLARSAMRGEAAVIKGAKAVLKSGTKIDHYNDVSDKGRDKLDKKLMAYKEDPSKLMELSGDLGHYMPDHASAAAATAVNAVNYLNSLRPNTDKAMPFDADIPADPVKEAQFHRALDIAQQPLIVFNDIKDGTVTPDDLKTLQNVAPGLYARMRDKLNTEIINHTADDGEIPYKTRLGMALFLGQPLDSTMTPMGIQNAQPKMAMPQPQMQAQVKPTATGMQKLGKMGAESATNSQLRQMSKIKHA